MPKPAKRSDGMMPWNSNSQSLGPRRAALVVMLLSSLVQWSYAQQLPNQMPYIIDGVAKQAKGDLDGAIADFTKAIELRPDLAISFEYRGKAKQAKGDLDGAIADFTKAIELKPDDAVAYSNRGFAKQAKSDLDGAIADNTKAIELRPDLAISYKYRGEARYAKGDAEGANADYAKAGQLEPNLVPAYGAAAGSRSSSYLNDAQIKAAIQQGVHHLLDVYQRT